jgi:hypothetical protein
MPGCWTCQLSLRSSEGVRLVFTITIVVEKLAGAMRKRAIKGFAE